MGEIRKSRFYKATITMGDNYKAFPRKKEVKREVYYKLIKDYYKEVRNLIIYNQYRYKFHCSVGTAYIIKYTPSFKRNPLKSDGTLNLYGREVDRLKTMKYAKEHPDKPITIYRDLSNFENYRFTLYWRRDYYKLSKVKFFNIKPCRIFTQMMLENVAKNNADYDLYFLNKL